MALSRRTWISTLLTVAAAAALCASLATANRAQIRTGQAVLTSMHGDVKVRHGAAGYFPAQLNEILAPNDAVRTGSASRAEISVGEGGYVRMDENSQVLITALASDGSSTFEALAGGLWVTIEKALSGAGKFEVRMPSAVASVKGTVFRCQVDDDGASQTWVYEGAVDVEAGDERYEVEPTQSCLVPRDLPAVVDRFNLSGDDDAAWVMYNRHRDIVKHLGDPGITVALRERNMPEEGAFATSASIAGYLALHGLRSTSIADPQGAEFELREDGTVRWARDPACDFCVIGEVTLERARRVDGGWSAVAAGDVRLVRNGESEAVTSIGVRVPGVGSDAKQAARAALDRLGRRVGAGLAPRIIRELMQSRAGIVRVDISGGVRGDVAELRRAITSNHGVLRTAPLVLPGRRISLAVVTDMSGEEIAEIVRTHQSDLLEQVVAGEQIVFVRYAEVERHGGAILRDLDDRLDRVEEQMGEREGNDQPEGGQSPQRPMGH
jgi:hypothetical protein